MTTTSVVLTIVGSLLGIIGTILIQKLDPKQRIYAQLDDLARKKIELEKQRDEALKIHDNNALTVAGNALIQLHNDQAALLQRLGTFNVR